MLEVLRRQELDGVLATVVRYFGGVKLGAGGLVRAYTEAVAVALLQAEKTVLQPQLRWTCVVPYDLEDAVRRHARTHGVVLAAVTHGDDVRLDLAGPATSMSGLREQVDGAHGGRARWEDPGASLTP